MAAPTVAASLDASIYAPGALMILTVNYADVDNQTFTVTVTVRDVAGNVSAPVSVQAVIMDPVSIAVADSSGRMWTLVRDNGTVAVYTANA